MEEPATQPHRYLVATLLAVALLAPRHGSAQAGPSARLAFERRSGAETCPDEPALRNAVAGRLGYDPFQASASRTVRVTLERTRRSFAAELILQGASGQANGRRSIVGDYRSCEELVSALALPISIAIDPLGTARPVPAPPAPPAPTPAAPILPDLDLGAGALTYVHSLPSVTLGATAGARLSWSRFRLGLAAEASFRSRLDVPGGSVEASRYGAALSSCLRAGVVSGCAVLAGGVFRVAGVGLSPSRTAAAPYLELGARGELELPLGGPISARLSAGIQVPLVRAQVMLTGAQRWETPLLAGVFGATLHWRL